MKLIFKSYRIFVDNCGCGLIHKEPWACGVIGFSSIGYGATREQARNAAIVKLKAELEKQYSRDETQYDEIEITEPFNAQKA